MIPFIPSIWVSTISRFRVGECESPLKKEQGKRKRVEELYVCSAKEILPSEGGKKLSNQFIVN